ncbi:hypothetical protein LNKW23_33420 [Paralimibaculum aggregatum]|uniref:Multifunctional fusion protein n=1 Tax=Paralimibaculum aggregatum TaxID=3036245 RepID=A0ABQ6LRF1_9RHOB|nr:phosphonate metabolism protein/1,5-bisphosphokinase (PRPP-forming) PhnN [Limibaculum sp. NKW23]GMG84128.1 hypothetical protein LNKW23_33420 [Limibaculum sp. NKW23]
MPGSARDQGKLVVIVGPSGVGKDTLIDGARARLAENPAFRFARRSITRPASAGGEAHREITPEAFEAGVAGGAFFVHWTAHGLGYGVPVAVLEDLRAGRNVVLNGSRTALPEIVARARAEGIEVALIHVDASPEVVAARLEKRGRESADEIRARRQRKPLAQVEGVTVATVINDGSVEEGIERFIAALLGAANLPLRLFRIALALGDEPICVLNAECNVVAAAKLDAASMVEISSGGRTVRARVAITTDDALVPRDRAALSPRAFDELGAAEGDLACFERSPSPKSRAVLRKKVGGGVLAPDEISLVMRDLIEGRYSPAETAGFLVSASTNLGFDEVVSLTRVRAEHMARFAWDAERVVDKHSMGGVPGSRITLIVIPIVAAQGLMIPKTSSRAITSAAGTADAMEAVARVDLDREEMRTVVEQCGGCIVWNGRISHSPIDDVMNAINRPLGVSSRYLDVSSILSKKLAAGATHVVIDLPAGPSTKLRDPADAKELAELFERVGRAVGLEVSARITTGGAPIGRGVGPALEVRDVRAVLSGDPGAPRDLREKALDFAGALLDWDPRLPPGTGRQRAEELLLSGAALERFEAIVAAQGARVPVQPGVFYREIAAPRPGRLARLDGFAVAGLARAAGAPTDKSAGVDILAAPGTELRAGEPVLRLHAAAQSALDRALSEHDPAGVFDID